MATSRTPNPESMSNLNFKRVGLGEEEMKLVERRSLSLSLIIIQTKQLPLGDNSSLYTARCRLPDETDSPLSWFEPRCST